MNKRKAIALAVIIAAVAGLGYLLFKDGFPEKNGSGKEPASLNRFGYDCSPAGDEIRFSTGIIMSEKNKEEYDLHLKELYEELDSAIEKDPNTYFNLAMTYRNKDQLDKACEYFFKALELNEGLFLAWSALGTVYEEMNDLAQSEKALRQAVTVRPQHVNSYVKLIALYKGRLEKSQNEIILLYNEAAINTAGEAGDLRIAYEYGLELEKAEMFEQAIKIFEAIVERDDLYKEEARKKADELKKL